MESAASKDKGFYLKKDESSLHLDHTHSYYYQVQTQMFVCNVDYCDFCVCTFSMSKEGHILSVFIEMTNSGMLAS